MEEEWIPLREELLGSEDDEVTCEECDWSGVLSDLLVNKNDENDMRHLCPNCKGLTIEGGVAVVLH